MFMTAKKIKTILFWIKTNCHSLLLKHHLLSRLKYRNLVLTFDCKIDIMEYDRTNWVTVYQGPFAEGFIAPWPNGSRIIILTNLNPRVSAPPNLYTVNLR